MVTMSVLNKILRVAALICFCTALTDNGAESAKPKFKVIAFFTGKKDDAHISFLREAE
jgi:hypothetical protein